MRHKEHLPVMELRFGDTGTINDRKFGEHKLDELRCTSDSKYGGAPFHYKRSRHWVKESIERHFSGFEVIS